jgi:hypothetical protein
VVFTEAALQVDWLQRLALSQRVCMEIQQILAVHILNGLFFKNQLLRQLRQQAVHGTLQPM